MLFRYNLMSTTEIIEFLEKYLADDDIPITSNLVRNFFNNISNEINEVNNKIEDYLSSYFIFGDDVIFDPLTPETKELVERIHFDIPSIAKIKNIIPTNTTYSLLINNMHVEIPYIIIEVELDERKRNKGRG